VARWGVTYITPSGWVRHAIVQEHNADGTAKLHTFVLPGDTEGELDTTHVPYSEKREGHTWHNTGDPR
jgi:hypothetical protein